MAARDKAIKANMKKKAKKESIETKLTEIGKEAEAVKLEAQLDFLHEYIQEKVDRVNSINEDENLKELVDKKKIKKFKKNKINKYILDLRNNPGGLLSQAIKISDFFLDSGEIVSTKSRKSSENRKYFAKKGDMIDGKILIVLINYGSASASEIVAGALKDHKRAILIGENTFGKGSVQSIIPLINNGAIRLTISKYYLPSGKSISEVGVIPDIEIAESSEDFRMNTKTDNQLDFAIKLLNG